MLSFQLVLPARPSSWFYRQDFQLVLPARSPRWFHPQKSPTTFFTNSLSYLIRAPSGCKGIIKWIDAPLEGSDSAHISP